MQQPLLLENSAAAGDVRYSPEHPFQKRESLCKIRERKESTADWLPEGWVLAVVHNTYMYTLA